MPRALTPVMAAILVVSACGAPADLAGADLPVAEMPESVEQITWGLPFAARFPSGFWTEGAHRYRFVVDCPAIGAKLDSSPVEFRVTSHTRTLDGRVFLRLSGLSDGIRMPSNVGALHPEQETTAVVTFLGLSEAAVDDGASCEGVMEYDGDQSAPMVSGVAFRP